MKPRKILIPVPDRDFDVTEVAVPWRLLTDHGHQVVFATEKGGQAAACDPRLLKGVLFGKLGAKPEAIEFYRQMEKSPEFQKPISWNSINPSKFYALVLPGGHAPGMKQYLASAALQEKVAEFWALGRPVAAICHGVIVLARAKDVKTGKSLLASRETTCLPKYMERMAYFLTFWKLGKYYRTYPKYVEDEVRAVLADPETQFKRGPTTLGGGETFVVEDRNYISARWPGDAHVFAQRLLEKL
ncbi:MAG: DJ-1/PfpI family protein [Deltaproteobacteria bacterium]|nr:DJ-1/PfpI family protein [Deltaproteobacteria bacterium]